jgi:hypothetical protein
MGGSYVIYGRNVYKILVGKPEGRKLLRRPRRRWEGSIKMDLKEIGWEVMGWIRLFRTGISAGLL